MLDFSRYNEIYKEIMKLQQGDILQLVQEAETQEEKVFWEMIKAYRLHKKQEMDINDNVKMNQDIANALSGYFDVLYRLNKRIIRLCGIIEPELEGIEIDVLDVVHDFGRLFPYLYNKKTNLLELNMRDGLLEFSNAMSYLVDEYDKILKSNYIQIDKIRIIRNKYEHKMHGIRIGSATICGEYADVCFAMCGFDDNDNHIDMNIKEFIEIILGLNELFSRISKEIAEWAENNNKTEYMYYEKITRFDFKEFNELYKSTILKKIGKIMFDF